MTVRRASFHLRIAERGAGRLLARGRHASVLLRIAKCGAGMRARRRGNFLLRRQKKVTKEEALNRTRAGRRQEQRAKTSIAVSGRREPLRSRCCPCDEDHDARFTPPNVGCTPDSPGNTNTASPERRCIWVSAREHGVQPRVKRAGDAMSDARDKVSSESAAVRVCPQRQRSFSRAAHRGVAMVCGSGPLLW